MTIGFVGFDDGKDGMMTGRAYCSCCLFAVEMRLPDHILTYNPNILHAFLHALCVKLFVTSRGNFNDMVSLPKRSDAITGPRHILSKDGSRDGLNLITPSFGRTRPERVFIPSPSTEGLPTVLPSQTGRGSETHFVETHPTSSPQGSSIS